MWSEGGSTEQMEGGRLRAVLGRPSWSPWEQGSSGIKAEVWEADQPYLFPSVHRGVW